LESAFFNYCYSPYFPFDTEKYFVISGAMSIQRHNFLLHWRTKCIQDHKKDTQNCNLRNTYFWKMADIIHPCPSHVSHWLSANKISFSLTKNNQNYSVPILALITISLLIKNEICKVNFGTGEVLCILM